MNRPPINPNTLTVCLVTHNRRETVDTNLGALFHHTRPMPRLCVADRGSNDGTRQLLFQLPNATIVGMDALEGPGADWREVGEGMQTLIWNQVETPWALGLGTDVKLCSPGFWSYLAHFQECDLACRFLPAKQKLPEPLPPHFVFPPQVVSVYPKAPCADFCLINVAAAREARQAGVGLRHILHPQVSFDPDPWSQQYHLHHRTFGFYYHWLLKNKRDVLTMEDIPFITKDLS